MKRIKLSQGKFAIVDDEDFEWLNQRNWCCLNISRRRVTYAIGRCNNSTILMHRIIIGARKGQIVDHINHNGLDNRKNNLRFVNRNQSASNTRRHENKKSCKYKGVSVQKDKKGMPKYWFAQICVARRFIRLGNFKTAKLAYLAYIKASKKYHKEFGCVG